MMKNDDTGITLIALVVTVIILIILACISVSVISGENGLLTKAIQSKNKTEEAAEKEAVELAVGASRIENVSTTNMTQENLKKAFEEQFGSNANVIITDNGDNSFIIKFNSTDRAYYIESSGNIIQNNNVLKISTAEELKKFRDEVNKGNTFEEKYIYLANDIILDENEEWIPISNFKGTFWGNNYNICNVHINKSVTEGESYQFFGLFGENKGTIQNLNVIGNIDIVSYSNNILVGLIAGLNSGTIKNSSSSGSISINGYQESGYIALGGIVGQNQVAGCVLKCSNSAFIQGKGKNVYAGGIVGSNNNKINSSYNTGKVQVTKKIDDYNIYIGGVSGYNGRGNIELCFNIADVVGDGDVGAICGLMGGSGETNIKKCKYNNSNLEGIGRSVYVSANHIDVEKDPNLDIEKILDILR